MQPKVERENQRAPLTKPGAVRRLVACTAPADIDSPTPGRWGERTSGRRASRRCNIAENRTAALRGVHPPLSCTEGRPSTVRTHSSWGRAPGLMALDVAGSSPAGCARGGRAEAGAPAARLLEDGRFDSCPPHHHAGSSAVRATGEPATVWGRWRRLLPGFIFGESGVQVPSRVLSPPPQERP